MRSHGIPSFPDPSTGGGGLSFHFSGNGPSPFSPAFRAAHAACSKLLPEAGLVNHRPSAEQIRQATMTAQCMRAHGVTGFPDPIISSGGRPPALNNPQQYGSIEDDGGIVFAIPNSISEDSPAFGAAAKKCNFGG